MKYAEVMMKTAKLFGDLSYCKRKKVGAVLAGSDGRILSTGYNGTISGQENNCEDAENKTLELVLHAEQNIISHCAKNGIPMESTTMYITISPCIQCAKMIAQSGVTKVIYGKVYKDALGLDFLKEVGVEVVKYGGAVSKATKLASINIL